MKSVLLCWLGLLPLALPAPAIEPDEEGCHESKLVSRVSKCRITECSSKEFDSADLTVAVKADEAVTKTVEGATEVLAFECEDSVSPLHIARDIEAALRKAGYKIVYSGKADGVYPMLTAQAGAQWVEVKTWDNGGPAYRQTAVKVQEMQQTVKASAADWAEAIEASGRVAIYGINFDTGKSTIKPESEQVLSELLALLNEHVDWKMRLEGHTDNVGAKPANLTLSQQRAAAVAAWLVGKGIDKSRLTAEGLGDTKPVADNATEEGRARNRRVELVKI